MDLYTALDLVVRADHHNATNSTNSGTSDTGDQRPPVYKAVGISLAVASGAFIGTSFVLKKTGLLKANVKYSEEAGEGYGYLKNAWWWSGMTLMIIGEICNFVAYAFVDAILVTPLGALSVVITTILSAIFLKERLSFVGKVGCFNCIIGSIVIVVNAPQQSSASTIQQMQHYVIAPGFLSYAGVIIVGCVVIALWAGPRYGKKSMLVYLSICSLIGGLSVVATQGLGAAIVTQISGTNQFDQWFLYVLFVFVVATLITEIIYLNKALNIFNAALVTPTYYVYFTSATIVTSAILFQGFKGTTIQILTIVFGFLQICSGVILLQLSKSAKDVPDTAIFKGDLDQVRTVAEQEEHESEPKADAIRGTSALIRSFSKARQEREASEAKRIYEERLEPIGEDEQVQWEGLRRRKTTIGSHDRQPSPRTVHPPWGLTRFPDIDDASSHASDNSPGLFPAIRARAASILHPNRRHTDSDPAAAKGPEAHTVALSDISRSTTREDNLPQAPVYGMPPDLRRATTLGLSSLHDADTAYNPPASALRREASPLTPGPTPPPHREGPSAARRQFSFHNPLRPAPAPRTPSSASHPDDRASSRGSLFGFRRNPSGGLTATTEEERLGLVTGDSREAAPEGGDVGEAGRRYGGGYEDGSEGSRSSGEFDKRREGEGYL